VDFVLGEQQLTVEPHLEGAAARFLEARGDRETAFDLGRQTGGARLVVSNDAIVNDDLVQFRPPGEL
jgi:hypothetical protein